MLLAQIDFFFFGGGGGWLIFFIFTFLTILSVSTQSCHIFGRLGLPKSPYLQLCLCECPNETINKLIHVIIFVEQKQDFDFIRNNSNNLLV